MLSVLQIKMNCLYFLGTTISHQLTWLYSGHFMTFKWTIRNILGHFCANICMSVVVGCLEFHECNMNVVHPEGSETSLPPLPLYPSYRSYFHADKYLYWGSNVDWCPPLLLISVPRCPSGISKKSLAPPSVFLQDCSVVNGTTEGKAREDCRQSQGSIDTQAKRLTVVFQTILRHTLLED